MVVGEDMDFVQMCPRYKWTINLLGKRWTGLILRALVDRPRRFAEIGSYIGDISDRLVSERLKELEEAGVIQRKVYTSRPVVVEYSLTTKGADLKGILEAVQEWADCWVKIEVETL